MQENVKKLTPKTAINVLIKRIHKLAPDLTEQECHDVAWLWLNS